MSMEYWHNDTDRIKPKYSDKNLPKCYSVGQNSRTDWHGIKSGTPWPEACD